jgi:hypothetical protein
VEKPNSCDYVLAATLASYVWDSKRKILACPYKLSFQALLKRRMNILNLKIQSVN